MAIPAFDKKGNIPVGDLFGNGPMHPLIHASLAELHGHFVGRFKASSKRPAIWNGWMRHRTELEATGIPFATLIGGSFTTIRTDPGDIDLCIIAEAAAVNQAAAADPDRLQEFARLTDTTRTKGPYLCDAYGLHLYPVTHNRFPTVAFYFNYWTRVFGIDRKGNQKAVFLVTESGVL